MATRADDGRALRFGARLRALCDYCGQGIRESEVLAHARARGKEEEKDFQSQGGIWVKRPREG